MDIKIDLHQHLSNCLGSCCDTIWLFLSWNNCKMLSVLTLSISHLFRLLWFILKATLSATPTFSRFWCSARVRSPISLAWHKCPSFQSARSLMMPGCGDLPPWAEESISWSPDCHIAESPQNLLVGFPSFLLLREKKFLTFLTEPMWSMLQVYARTTASDASSFFDITSLWQGGF